MTDPGTLTLYRGLSVPDHDVEATLASLRAEGHVPSRAWRRMVQRAVQDRSRIPAGDLPTLADTRGVGNEAPSICACGDETGASHYAWRTGGGHTPIVIELSVAADRVAVDGNDFLHTLFSLGEPSRAGPAIDAAFGPAALAYARRAWALPPGDESRIALCDLALADPEVVRHHLASTLILSGRHQVLFRSAFTVRLPVDGGMVSRAWVPDAPPRWTGSRVDFRDLL